MNEMRQQYLYLSFRYNFICHLDINGCKLEQKLIKDVGLLVA